MSTKAQSGRRLAHVDVLRGLAVVAMITLHTAHGWLVPEARAGGLWEAIRAVGGMAAPLFLWLSGVSLGLRMPGPGARPAGGAGADTARGLQILLLGYLLRVQMWMLDGGGMLALWAWAAALPLAGGYLLAYRELGRVAHGGAPSPARLAGAALACGAGLLQVAAAQPSRLEGLLRVDVLQAIGASLVLVSLLARALRQQPAALLLCGIGAACLTPWMRARVPGPLPDALAAYLAWWDPGPGRHTSAMFPLLPWIAYVFVGAAVGQGWRPTAGGGVRTRRLLWQSALGAVLAAACWEGWPWVHALLRETPGATQPLRVLYRVSLALALTGPALGLARVRPLAAPLKVLGSGSLLVYWVHLEFAFGRAATPLRAALEPRGWALGLATLTAAMVGLVLLRRRSQAWRGRRKDSGLGELAGNSPTSGAPHQ